MTPELTALASLVALQVVFGLLTSWVVSTRTGAGYILSSREADADLETGFVGRMHRARVNNFEALIYFTPTVMVVTLADISSSLTAIAAWTFVAARIGFLLCYAFDLTPWRSFVWMAGTIAIVVMLWVVLV